MKESCYEVECPNPRAAREFLQAAEGVLSVEPSGATLHLFLSPLVSAAALEKALHDTGPGPASFRPIVPSLEDVFIAQIRKVSRENDVGR